MRSVLREQLKKVTSIHPILLSKKIVFDVIIIICITIYNRSSTRAGGNILKKNRKIKNYIHV